MTLAIPGFDGYYTINTSGDIYKVRGAKAGRIMQPSTNAQGYKFLRLTKPDGSRGSYRVHRLVALTYIPNPKDKPQVNHIDGDKSNNDVSNLEWVDQWANMDHAKRNGLIRRGDTRTDKQQAQAKLNGYNQGKRNRKVQPSDVVKIKELRESGMSWKKISISTGFGSTTVRRYAI